MKHADYYEALDGEAVRCLLCPHNCEIKAGCAGICGVRRNEGGVLYAESNGRVTSLALDPIEKKPLYRFFPGSMILSLGGYGCNFRCGFCQNHEISMKRAEYREMTPEALAALSLELEENGNIGVAYTYNEPLIAYEFVRDSAVKIRGQNQKNVLVTNGFICAEPLNALLPVIDAMNIDLKSFSPDFYKQIGGSLEPVKKTIETAAKACHVEVTTLVIPGKNDSPEEIESLASWLSGVSPEIPLHLSRFFPRYKMTELAHTPLETMLALEKISKKHLKYVFLGNC